MSSISEVYSKMIDLFQDKSSWTQNYYARDLNGNMCGVRDPEARFFCALGAIWRFSEILVIMDKNALSHKAQCCLQRVSEHLFNGDIIQKVNDSEDGYLNVLKALAFARDLWKDHEPTDVDLIRSIPDLLASRKTE